MLERIDSVLDMIQEAQDQNGTMDLQDPTTNIKSDIDNKKSNDQMHSILSEKLKLMSLYCSFSRSRSRCGDQQMEDINVNIFHTFRGGTELIYNLNPILLSENDEEAFETIMFWKQTAKQFQSKGQKYQDEMKDKPISGIKRRRRIGQISDERRKFIKAHVQSQKPTSDFSKCVQLLAQRQHNSQICKGHTAMTATKITNQFKPGATMLAQSGGN